MAPRRRVMSKKLCHWTTLPSLNIDHPKDDKDVNNIDSISIVMIDKCDEMPAYLYLAKHLSLIMLFISQKSLLICMRTTNST